MINSFAEVFTLSASRSGLRNSVTPSELPPDFVPARTVLTTAYRSRHVSREASQFLWMATHDGYMVGTHWLRTNMSEELKMRAVCMVCGEIETMTHIAFECAAKGQELIWELLKRLWSHTGVDWHEPSWGTTFGAPCAVFTAPNGCRRTTIEHLWCILCTEALHLVWKLRCERVIGREGEQFTEAEVANRFYATIESRLNLDRRTAAISRKGKKALKPCEVERIWLPVIANGDALPPRWVVDIGVLVGIRRDR